MGTNDHAKIIRFNYGGATVWIRGRKVMNKGKVLDPKWWKKKLRLSVEVDSN